MHTTSPFYKLQGCRCYMDRTGVCFCKALSIWCLSALFMLILLCACCPKGNEGTITSDWSCSECHVIVVSVTWYSCGFIGVTVHTYLAWRAVWHSTGETKWPATFPVHKQKPQLRTSVSVYLSKYVRRRLETFSGQQGVSGRHFVSKTGTAACTQHWLSSGISSI